MSSKRAQWAKRMQAWARSRQSRVEFCRTRGLNTHTFDYWRRVLRAVSTPSSLPPASRALVPVVVSGLGGSPAIEIALPNGIRLRVPNGAEVAQVRDLAQALLPC